MAPIAVAQDHSWLRILLPMSDMKLPDHYLFRHMVRLWPDKNGHPRDPDSELFIQELPPEADLLAIHLEQGWGGYYCKHVRDLLGDMLSSRLLLLDEKHAERLEFQPNIKDQLEVPDSLLLQLRATILGDCLNDLRA